MSKFTIAPTPEEVIDDAIQRQDWFSAFSNAVSYFEFWAYIRLGGYCRKENIHIEQIMKRLTARELNLILYLLKLRDSNIFNKMIKTIQERNHLVHPISTEYGIGYRHRKQRDRAIKPLEDAKYCTKKVREGAISFK
jgi:hypothetical protein